MGMWPCEWDQEKNAANQKKHGEVNREAEMREEYDFSRLKRVDREVFFERLLRERGGRMLNPELARRFPDDESVNAALSELLRLKRDSA